MQVTKQNIQGIFNKLKLEVRSTGHQYAWLMHDGKKYSVSTCRMEKGIFPDESQTRYAANCA